jgi:hypothetical protein
MYWFCNWTGSFYKNAHHPHGFFKLHIYLGIEVLLKIKMLLGVGKFGSNQVKFPMNSFNIKKIPMNSFNIKKFPLDVYLTWSQSIHKPIEQNIEVVILKNNSLGSSKIVNRPNSTGFLNPSEISITSSLTYFKIP